jgi:predicted DNA-binding transcriptional regulator AlpA
VTVALFGGRHHLDRRALALIEAANEGTDDELLSTTRVAVWLGVSPEWVEIGRSKGWGPPYVRLSPRRIRYRRGDVKKWLQERAHRSTDEYDTGRQGRAPGSKVIAGRVVPPEAPDAA